MNELLAGSSAETPKAPEPQGTPDLDNENEAYLNSLENSFSDDANTVGPAISALLAKILNKLGGENSRGEAGAFANKRYLKTVIYRFLE